MEEALNSKPEIPRDPAQLRQVIRNYETSGNKSKLQKERKTQAAIVLSLIDRSPEEHKDLLIVTAETLRKELTEKIVSGNIGNLSVGFYADLANYIRISELLNDGFNAWELVKYVADMHLDLFDNIKSSEFVSYDSEFILRPVNILRVFNRQIPGIYEAVEMQAEAELLYANFTRTHLDHNIKAGKIKKESIDVGIEKVRTDFESALSTALTRLYHPDEDKTEVFSLLEDIAASYGDWLISIGEKESAKDLCEDIYIRNADTRIFENLGFTHPKEESLRKRATQNALKTEFVRSNADTHMDFFSQQAKAEGLQLEALLDMYEGRVIAAAKVLNVLAEADTEIAQQTSRSISGGHPLLKDPYGYKDPNEKSYNN